MNLGQPWYVLRILISARGKHEAFSSLFISHLNCMLAFGFLACASILILIIFLTDAGPSRIKRLAHDQRSRQKPKSRTRKPVHIELSKRTNERDDLRSATFVTTHGIRLAKISHISAATTQTMQNKTLRRVQVFRARYTR